MKDTNTHTEMNPLKEYTTKRYPRITLSMGESGSQISKAINEQGKMFDKLYRGVPSNWDFLESLTEGDEVKLNHKPGFISTTQDERIARKFASDDDSEIRIVFEIRDAHGLDVSEISKWDEQEVLLDKDQTFNVVDISRQNGSYWKVIVN